TGRRGLPRTLPQSRILITMNMSADLATTERLPRPQIAWMSFITLTLRILETLAIAVAAATSYWMVELSTDLPPVYALVIGCGTLMSVILLHTANAYTPSLIDNAWLSVGRALSVWLSVCLLLIAGTFFSKPDVAISRDWALTSLLFVAGALVVLRGITALIV